MKITCFLIDDDPDDTEIFDIALADSGFPYSLICIDNPVKALNILEKGALTVDYIFIDLNMPLLSGFECLARIRTFDSYSNVPLIVYSTSSYGNDIEKAKEQGACYFITKTADLEGLSMLLKRLFSGAQLPFYSNPTLN